MLAAEPASPLPITELERHFGGLAAEDDHNRVERVISSARDEALRSHPFGLYETLFTTTAAAVLNIFNKVGVSTRLELALLVVHHRLDSSTP